MPAGWIAAGSALLNVVGGIGAAKKGKKAAKKWSSHTRKRLDKDREIQRQALVGEEHETRTNLADTILAYDRARKEISSGASGARLEARDQGRRVESELTSNAVASGRVGTSAYDGARRRISGDLSRVLANIDTGLGHQYAELSIARSKGVGHARDKLSAFYRRRADVERDIMQGYQSLDDTKFGGGLAGAMQGGQSIDYSALLSLFGGGSGDGSNLDLPD